ncbi:TonB-dependent siderophore receptor [Caenispirillum bisanense]|uniref:Iron complex outermembrane recepter protein n=1 Tax=Caenispirillum bisanense TaxID=414052 RepID=A0A286GK90_9PROT|nr:TonB-dependent siderophore receptor [Caenispirillum bisanense]SOD95955.1 iron complex outermembrane recepter protein [Caenispirillum bisanense]
MVFSWGTRKAAWLLTTALVSAAAPAAAAEQISLGSGVEQVAQATPAYDLSIGAQPLSAALDAFVAATGWQLGYAAPLVSGVQSPGVSGRMSGEAALAALLSGTGVTYRLTDPATAVLEAVPADAAAMQLDPIRVEALRSITSYEGTDGYVSYFSVAATKTDTPVIKTPQSVSTVAREELRARDVKTVAEAVRYSPGVVVDGYGVDPRGFDSIAIRGFASATTGSFRDGLRMDGNFFAAYTSEPYGLERVDIMRGPSGAVYGQAEAGGVVDRTSKRPRTDLQQEVYIEGGSYETVEGGFDLGGAVTDDKTVAVRLVGVARTGDTEFDYNDGTPQEHDRLYIAPSLTWAPTADTSLTLLTDYMKDDRSTIFGTLATEAGRTNVVPGEPGFDRFEQEQASIGTFLTHRFNESWQFRQSARYTHIDVDYQTVAANYVEPDGRTLQRYVWASPDVLDQFTIDNQLETRFDAGPTAHVVLLGADYSHSTDSFSYYNGAVAPLDLTDVRYSGAVLPAPYQVTEQTLEQAGLYLQDQITFYEDWVLTLGGRYSWVEQTTEQKLAGTTEEKKDSAFTGRLGLSYVFDNGVAPYVAYTEGFTPTEGTDLSGESFEPQDSKQYEVGVKYQPPATNALFTAAVYQLTKTNVLTRDPSNINASVQAGEVRARGLELEAKASLFTGWDVALAYAYTDAEVTKSNDIDLGKVPVQVPEHTASGWLTYTIDTGPLAGLTLGGGLRYVGSAFNDRANTSKADDYTLVDAMLSYELTDSATLQVNANNLFDTEYVTTCAFNACYYGPGMRVNARVTYAW